MTAPELILTGGTIITVDADDSTAEAIAVTDGVVTAIGTAADVAALADENTTTVHLDGHTVVPGFVDAHSHVSMGAPYIKHAPLQPAPTGDVRTVDDIIRKLHESKDRNQPEPGDYVIGWGYYPEEMQDDGVVTADMLDREFPDHKVVIVHISGHGGVANTRVLEARGYRDGVADPEGGTVVRYEGTETPNGVLWEQAWMPLMFGLFDYDESATLEMLHEYARWGLTTVQDGAATAQQVRDLRNLAESKGLPVDVRTLVIFSDIEEVLGEGLVGTESHGHCVQGMKLILDGSPQGRTAHVTEEYVTGGPGGEQHWHGIAVIAQADTDALIELAYRNGVQVFAHVNGDAAIDQLISAHRAAVAAGATAPGRTIPIHSQVMRLDQLDDYVAEGFEPSMFTVHTYLFGDTHIKNFGEERAFGISPMRAAIDKGLKPTNHSDYPITPLNPLLLLWSSVVRRSSGGVVLGDDQRVTPLEGLKALTINAAYEHRLDADRGSIEVGKLADLVVLDANPLEVDPDAIRDISIHTTYKRGVSVYQA